MASALLLLLTVSNAPRRRAISGRLAFIGRPARAPLPPPLGGLRRQRLPRAGSVSIPGLFFRSGSGIGKPCGRSPARGPPTARQDAGATAGGGGGGGGGGKGGEEGGGGAGGKADPRGG